MLKNNVVHEPVVLEEALEFLNVKKGGKFIDATLGGGGHGVAIIERGGRVLGIDVDPDAIEITRQKIKSQNLKIKIGEDLILVHGNFKDIEKIAREHGFIPVDGMIFDLGMSSMQIESSGRGFSFMRDEPLDMRVDPDREGVTAADLINALREDQLYELFSQTSKKIVARAVACAIVRARTFQKIERTSELVNLVENIPARQRYAQASRARHPATTIFLALRIAVNEEFNNLELGLKGALGVLKRGGRLVVISFHSGEDRIVKRFFKREERLNTITKKPLIPRIEEVVRNPRARSAKLRVAEKN